MMFDSSAAAADGSQLGLGTLAMQGGQSPDPSSVEVMPPTDPTSTYVQRRSGLHQAFDYPRTHNPTRFAGHTDISGGKGVVRDDEGPVGHMAFPENSRDAVHGSFDSFLALRGLKAALLRIKAHRENAQALAEHPESRVAIKTVVYPGLKSHKHHFENATVFTLTESLGALGRLINRPAVTTNASIPTQRKQQRGTFCGLVRLSAGTEALDGLHKCRANALLYDAN